MIIDGDVTVSWDCCQFLYYSLTAESEVSGKTIVRPGIVLRKTEELARDLIWRELFGSPADAVSKGQIPLRYLVAGRPEAGRRPPANWNLARLSSSSLAAS